MAGQPNHTTVNRVCAWCHGLIDREPWPYLGTGEVTTWGVCDPCVERIRDTEGEPRPRGARRRVARAKPSGTRSRGGSA